MENVRSIDRALSLMEIVGAHNREGMRLVDIVAESGLQKTTTSRILATLVNLGWVDVDESTDRYHLGLSVVTLGAAASSRFGISDLAQPALARVAEATQDTVYLSIKSGYEAVCIDALHGGWPIRTLTLRVGDRRPLGVGAGSLAILSWLPDDERNAVLAANDDAYNRWPALSGGAVRALVEDSRARGFAFNDQGLIPGVSGVGVPLLSATGVAFGALSVAAVDSRLDASRRDEIARMLGDEALTLAGLVGGVVREANESAVRRLAPTAP